jgi:hypothetical protein
MPDFFFRQRQVCIDDGECPVFTERVLKQVIDLPAPNRRIFFMAG